MKKLLVVMAVLALLSIGGAALASLSVQNGELAGTTDWLADVRFRNFNSTISDYEMMVNASPTRTVGQNQVNGQVPGPYAFADWATNNAFTITYDPGAALVSLRLVGTGTRQLGTPGGYDVTISRAPDAVASPVNYISLQLWDRVNFPTFVDGLTISDLDGNDLGAFSLASSGIGNWSILDSGGSTLNNGFVLNGSFALDLSKVAEGKEGDKIIFAIGSNPNANAVPEPMSMILGIMGLSSVAGFRKLRRK